MDYCNVNEDLFDLILRSFAKVPLVTPLIVEIVTAVFTEIALPLSSCNPTCSPLVLLV